MKRVFVGYLIALTYLLVAPKPLGDAHTHADLYALLRGVGPLSHVLSFALLALLAFATRWPAGRWAVTLCLIVYAGGTELLQTFMPGRHPEFVDCLQNLLGITIGGLVYSFAAWARRGIELNKARKQRTS